MFVILRQRKGDVGHRTRRQWGSEEYPEREVPDQLVATLNADDTEIFEYEVAEIADST